MYDFPDQRSDRKAWRLGFAVVFFGGLVLGPVLRLTCETRVSRNHPMPAWQIDAVRDGRYARQLENHLEHTSPITRFLRTRFHEIEWLLGTFESSRFTIRPGAWLFLSSTLNAPIDAPDQARADRIAFFEALGRRAQRDGLRVIAAVAPNKERIYPERAYTSQVVATAHASGYRSILDELRTAGLDAIDVETLLREHRRTHPADLLYHRRDMHWAFSAGSLVARAVGRRITALGRGAGPVLPLTATLAFERDSHEHVLRTLGFDSMTWVTRWVEERAPHMGPWLEETSTWADTRPTDEIALCGDSYAQAAVRWALPIVTSRGVDVRGVIAGGGPCQGLMETLARIDKGTSRARTIVWVFIEWSAFGHGFWQGLALNKVEGEGR